MEDYLGSSEGVGERKEAKWNVFRFQDHLVSWISLSAQFFQEGDYPQSFSALTIVYTDSLGFIDGDEAKVITEKYNQALTDNNAYINYNNSFNRNGKERYNPPTQIYHSLIVFRHTLLTLLASKNLLMVMVKKGNAGAGDI